MLQVVTKTKHYQLQCEWEIDEFSLRAKTDGHFISPEFSVDGLPDVKWWLIIYPNGIREPHDHLSAYIKIQSLKSIYLLGKFFVKGTTLKKRVRHTFTKTAQTHGSKCLIPLNELYETYVQDGKLIIELQATIALNETATTNLINNNNDGEGGVAEITPSLATFMFKDDASKDIEVIVENESIKVHSKVLAYHSPVFERMFNNGGMQESIERKVNITDFDYQVVQAAIFFCYDMYSPGTPAAEYPLEQLLCFADKYNMQKLMDFCEKSLISKINITNVCRFIQLANDANAFCLKEKCLKFMSAHIDSTVLFDGFEALDPLIIKQVMLNIVTPKNQ